MPDEPGFFGRISNWVTRHKEVITLTLAVVAGRYTIIQYQLSVEAAKVARTIESKKRLDEGDIRDAYKKLALFWLTDPKGVDLNERFNVNQTIKRDKFNAELNAIIKSEGHTEAILLLRGHYADVAVCVRSGLCSANAACALYQDDVNAFRHLYYDFLYSWGVKWKSRILDPLNEFGWACKKLSLTPSSLGDMFCTGMQLIDLVSSDGHSRCVSLLRSHWSGKLIFRKL